MGWGWGGGGWVRGGAPAHARLAQHCIHASHLKSAPAHVHRSRATDGVGSWGGVGGGGGVGVGWGPFLCIAVSTACTNDPGQKRPACRDDPAPRVQTIRIPACTDDALTSRVYS